MRQHYLCCLTSLSLMSCGQASLANSVVTNDSMPAAAVDFDRYWATFRMAALARDMRKLSTLSAFPVRSKGELDDDPVKLLTSATFPAELSRVLAAPADEEGGTKPPSLLDRIRATPHLNARDIDGGDHQRFGRLGFTRVGGKWALTAIYRGAD